MSKSLYLLLMLVSIVSPISGVNAKEFTQASTLKVTTLSTMLASRGIGEWGYSALIEVDGKKILFDTGNRPETVLQNAQTLGIDLSDVEDVILSHNHGDHTGGLLTLRKTLRVQNPKALSRIHVGKGIFAERANSRNSILTMRDQLIKLGSEFIVYEKPTEIFPGVWLTGQVPRVHPEKNWSGKGQIVTQAGLVEDNIPEDLSLVIDTNQGFVLISGCGHAGIINTMEHITANIHPSKIAAAIGGFHLVSATDEHLAWTAKKLQDFGVDQMIGAHCTGIDALYTLRGHLASDRKHMVVGSIGDQFTLKTGIKAGFIAH
ncbi:MBL fold metallo-hydrolase [Shewanella woodyi]|uniref:Beta-lactamase domain protein n=1 Tax=Shewanella woodyi (strain ATCC 51908 / MS32) TaxID=392500 RepID=B1KJJ4_SHEWM|nr:MBL fold metallo-hydrolase [Shewanella woodyi]ACA85667.1 beta-lactamase domain protein [Shewanella woodyi ATCC 51908]